MNGGFHGEVVEAGGQVDPQPRAQPMREAGAPLRGARITGFTSKDDKTFSLKYEVGGETHYVNYVLSGDRQVKFESVDARGRAATETYSPQERRGPARPRNGEPRP